MVMYLWRKYADYVYSKWEKTILWDIVEPYRRPRSFTPPVTIYVCAFYTGVIGAVITEQLYKEKYWERTFWGSSASNETNVLWWPLESNERGCSSNRNVQCLSFSSCLSSFKWL
uniref:Uncharacterized protein At4g29660 n=1 Tax=Nicotiana tabacum TaxID=4097 RepID=A0A1S3Y092_TOBAC|nr:uncharacterized protein At4g29660-like isoform X1 [Nicotiana tomentosiformis]XP_009603571.1 uncharacterized protein At4g29660-like isoform X1 [Nicotiana tomentosiformis]XP_009603572.1 uncharacterized protein At4g29660-like isoform X1 [Nicotiana tomentosiformis]XP_016445402.1 PREDICTED: uncharacterized protein At4g29660-like [Nicotiana tabacum]